MKNIYRNARRLGDPMIRLLSAMALAAVVGCGGDDSSSSGGGGATSDGGGATGGSGGANLDGGGSGGLGAAAGDASAGSGGASGSGGANADAQTGTCPTGLPGPTLVRVPTLSGGAYCMDATEVTMAQYEEFLQTAPATTGQPSYCAWNSSFKSETLNQGYCYTPGKKFDPTGTPDHPVQCVDWCDARAYCEWAGKRLCGRIGGGGVETTKSADATESEWYNACSQGGKLAYPYGGTYEPQTCVTTWSAPKATSEPPKCEGGFPGLRHLSGNVGEWEDGCSGATGPDDICLHRSGGYNAAEFGGCDTVVTLKRSFFGDGLGIRCCTDAGGKK